MKWIPVLNVIVYLLSKIMQDDNKNGIPDFLELKNEVSKTDE